MYTNYPHNKQEGLMTAHRYIKYSPHNETRSHVIMYIECLARKCTHRQADGDT